MTTIATHLITALRAAGIHAEEGMDSIQWNGVNVEWFSILRVWSATGSVVITGATRHGMDADDYAPTYDVDYDPADHASFLAEHQDRDGCCTPIYLSEGERLSLDADTAALIAAITPYCELP
ncbi:hypothetical protein [Streptomyces sp. NPDC059708]|uniref:hypothetical protein n=1 Tax=Streptomyces sp. NPDC059708 TaxID=3346916 RepID=UPI0036B2E979